MHIFLRSQSNEKKGTSHEWLSEWLTYLFLLLFDTDCVWIHCSQIFIFLEPKPKQRLSCFFFFFLHRNQNNALIFHLCKSNPQAPLDSSVFIEIHQFSLHRLLNFLDRPLLPSIYDDQEQHLIHEPKRRVLPLKYDFSSLYVYNLDYDHYHSNKVMLCGM